VKPKVAILPVGSILRGEYTSNNCNTTYGGGHEGAVETYTYFTLLYIKSMRSWNN